MIRQPVFQFLLKDNHFNCRWSCILQPTEHLIQPGPELISVQESADVSLPFCPKIGYCWRIHDQAEEAHRVAKWEVRVGASGMSVSQA